MRTDVRVVTVGLTPRGGTRAPEPPDGRFGEWPGLTRTGLPFSDRHRAWQPRSRLSIAGAAARLAGRMPPMKAVALVIGLVVGCAGKQTPAPGPPPGRILGIGHMALYVSDLVAARGFYEGFLGFEEAYTPPRPDGGDRIAFVKVNEEQYLELFA